MSKKVLVGYHPDDFFYASVQDHYKIDTTTCEELQPYSVVWDVSCDATHVGDNSFNCFQVELCKNKNYANELENLEQTHSGAEEQLANSNMEYNVEITKTVNLSVGILFLAGLAYSFSQGKLVPPNAM